MSHGGHQTPIILTYVITMGISLQNMKLEIINKHDLSFLYILEDIYSSVIGKHIATFLNPPQNCFNIKATVYLSEIRYH